MEHVILCFIEDEFGAATRRETALTASASRTTTRTPTRSGPTRRGAHGAALSRHDLTDDEIDKMTHRNSWVLPLRPVSVRPRERCTVRRAGAEVLRGTMCRFESKVPPPVADGPVSVAELTVTATASRRRARRR